MRIRKKFRSFLVFSIIFFLFFLFIIIFTDPNERISLPFFSISYVNLFFASLFFAVMFASSYLLKSVRHGIVIGGFIVTFLVLRMLDFRSTYHILGIIIIFLLLDFAIKKRRQ